MWRQVVCVLSVSLSVSGYISSGRAAPRTHRPLHLHASTAAAPATTKIAVIGTGDVGSTLARGFASKGYPVVIGTREPSSEKVVKLLEDVGFGVSALQNAAAVAGADVVVLAVNGHAAEAAIESIGVDVIGDKIVIDAMNPINYDAATGLHLAGGYSTSLGEFVQGLIPNAKCVKAFNVVGFGLFIDPPSFNGVPPDMFIAGDDAKAKEVVTSLLHAVGWGSVLDFGGIIECRYLEPIALMWIRLSYSKQSRMHAFKLLQE